MKLVLRFPTALTTAFTTAVVTALAAAGAVIPAALHAQPPRTPDIYLAPLTLGAKPTVGTPTNVTHRDGYDNQPSFVTAGDAFLFTSVREGGQSDIYRYDVTTGSTTQVTRTPESEYSATPIPDGSGISVVRVERDSTQRLWRFPANGTAPTLVLERVKPVGYHAWADDHTLLLFVLGNPNTLQLADTRTGRSDTILTNVGRSMHKVPGARQLSFVHKRAEHDWWIVLFDPSTKQQQALAQLPDGTEDYAWTPDGSIIAGKGSTLLEWPRGGTAWRQIADFSGASITGITRIAVSPKGDRIAFVADGVAAAR
jgi:hypothetical protein